MVTFGQPLVRFDSVDSTQNVAREMVLAGCLPGTVVTAQSMTAGRGRRGRSWHVPFGANVCLTAVGPPLKNANAAWQLAFLAGLAACEAVREIAPETCAALRFPNDLTVQNKKAGGVLIETIAHNKQIVPLVGIGINVKTAGMPPDLANKTVALETAADRELSVSDVEAALCARLSFWWNEWETSGFSPVIAAWKARADFGQTRLFVVDDAPVLCRVSDVAGDGSVALVLPNGETRTIKAAQVILGNE